MDLSSHRVRRSGRRLFTGVSLAAGVALAAGLALTAPSTAATTSPAPTPTPSCAAQLRTIATWEGGYATEVAVTAGSTPITRWETILPGDLNVYYVWGGTLTDRTVSSWGEPMAAGTTTYFGFTAGGSLATPPPLACRAFD